MLILENSTDPASEADNFLDAPGNGEAGDCFRGLLVSLLDLCDMPSGESQIFLHTIPLLDDRHNIIEDLSASLIFALRPSMLVDSYHRSTM